MDQYAGTDNYILAPDQKISRQRVMADTLSRGFSHYYCLLNTDKKLTFKSLRKYYITQAELFMGKGKAQYITGHSGNQILKERYIDKKEIIKAVLANGFDVVPDEVNRDQELLTVRTKIESVKESKTPER